MRNILLLGNPNTGKSAIFSRLTGAKVIASNYPGTTVEYTKGIMRLPGGEKVEILDIPGIYSLDISSRAEEVAVNMIKQGDLIINVIDATNLERNLNLTVQVFKKFRIPAVIALNMTDIARHHGINIDTEKLSAKLGLPVVHTIALSGEGIKELTDRLAHARIPEIKYTDKEKWNYIGNIVEDVQKTEHRHPTFGENLADITVHPILGLVFALLVLFVSFMTIRIIGESFIRYAMEPVFNGLYKPLLESLSGLLGENTIIHKLLIGNLINQGIDFRQSFGLLSTGLYIPIAEVLPYVFSFYIVLTLLEDIGYLPRLGILVDNLMHRIGLHGLSVISMFLAFGCNVPGALATRVLESRKERFITSTLMAIAIPCMAQIAMISGLLGKYGAPGFFTLFIILFLVWLFTGMILKKYIKGESPEILVDIPPYHYPYPEAIVKKVWMRIRHFIAEAIPFVLLGVFIVDILYLVGFMELMGKIFAPVIIKVFGLPAEAISALLVGFLRKDVAIGMLAPLELNFRQLIVASTVLTIYFPCVATFIVLLKELGIRDMVKSALIMLTTALIVGGAVNWILVLSGLS
jgi:ferrous iron transport protein B